jgi:integrase
MKCHKFPLEVKVGSAAVKIYHGKVKHGGKKYDLFTLGYYQNGKRQRKTFGNFDDAKKAAGEVALKIAQGRANVMELNGSELESYSATMNLLRPHNLPLHSVVQEYLAAREHLHGESLLSAVKEHAARRQRTTDKSVAQVVDEMLAAKKNHGLSERYIYMLGSDLGRFKKAFRTNIGSVTTRLIEDWLSHQKISGRTHNNLRASIITLFNFAKARGYLLKGQPTEADDVPRSRDRGGKIGILKPEQFAKLIGHATGEVRLYFALGAFTGMRASEILRLDWEDINFERNHITVAPHKAKTATRRLVPIQPNLARWLEPYRNSKGKIFLGKRVDSQAIAFAASRAIEWPHNCLRHSFATYRLAAVADTARVALEMGNSPQKLMTNYRELADEHDAAAWFAIAPKRSKKIVSFAA